MIYPSSYYQSGNYKDYLSRGDKYDCLAADLSQHALTGCRTVLDFGCGVGFLVKSLIKLGYWANGYDVSPWPIEYGVSVLKNGWISTNPKVLDKTYDAMTALDVFEHMPVDEVESILDRLAPRLLIVRIPVCERPGENFFLDVSRNDPTHITCMTKAAWNALFVRCKFTGAACLSSPTIWDSPGVLCAVYRRGC